MTLTAAPDLAGALQIAVDAARESASLVRADFLQPGGALCRDPHHAPVDAEVEQLVRSRLLAGTPGWGFRGEETGYTPADHSSLPIWVVDPNDGTYFYCQGSRGSALAIALLHGSVPVLGVVYAHLAPDNRGDLFSWAEGCGPLQRNGRAWQRPPWESRLAPSTVVIVSQDGNRSPLANLTCVAPARYRAEVSIAYRLALAAAGEAEVAVSLGGTKSWDYAAGHALLRGVGGDLVDENGRPMIYDATGMGRNRFIFGGAPQLVREVARRPWASVLSAPKTPADSFGLYLPAPGQHITDNDLLQRVQGCWLGLLAGDVLADEYVPGDGQRLSSDRPVVLARGPAASASALLLARRLVRDGKYSAAAMAAAYRSSDGTDPLPRQAPLSIWGHALEPDAIDHMSRNDTALSDDTAVSRDACAALAVALHAILAGSCGVEEAYDRAQQWHDVRGETKAVGDSLVAAARTPFNRAPHTVPALAALQCAFYQALHAEDFAGGVLAALPQGHLAGAATGALLGAHYGASVIPPAWRTAILTCRPAAGAPGVVHPQPEARWPTDAMVLAERLATH